MNIKFLIALKNIQIKGFLGKGDRLDDHTYISNDSSVIRTLLPESSAKMIGMLEYNFLLESNAFIYSKEKLPEGVTAEDFLITKLYQVQAFLTVLWAHKDNSVDFDLGFIFFEDADGREGVTSNSLPGPISNSAGDFVEETFSRDDLKKVRSFYRQYIGKYIHSPDGMKATLLYKGRSRLEMAFYHIMGARLANDVGIKITNYCSALEALFSTSQAELSHQLSERLAFFISKNEKERLLVYRKSKKAYTTRSKIVHGSSIHEKDFDNITEQSLFCDEVLRKTFDSIFPSKEITRVYDGKNETLDGYMLDLIFGVIKCPNKTP